LAFVQQHFRRNQCGQHCRRHVAEELAKAWAQRKAFPAEDEQRPCCKGEQATCQHGEEEQQILVHGAAFFLSKRLGEHADSHADHGGEHDPQLVGVAPG
jgi:hypothetical protein